MLSELEQTIIFWETVFKQSGYLLEAPAKAKILKTIHYLKKLKSFWGGD